MILHILILQSTFIHMMFWGLSYIRLHFSLEYYQYFCLQKYIFESGKRSSDKNINNVLMKHDENAKIWIFKAYKVKKKKI